MDDIDRELKKVQLQRERLALERELALKDASNTAKNVAVVVASGAATPFKAIGRLFARWWKVMLLICLIVAGIAVAISWQERQKEAALEAAIKRWDDGYKALVRKKCLGTNSCRPGKNYNAARCLVEQAEQSSCQLEAWYEHEEQFPYPTR